ncbi:toxin-antitoxin system HicB family antitoxin [Accumulibacter sp.]|uniref:toxin-antitoxin system HicB family antitoxin n=1 Tax=Accumulibacter sp. TaxID=2053492 RepID=UPI0025CF683E|nr:toxin-antitoxin system HicB family antitoxin [Accumulibacter sp.]MCM8610853.1 toxin-antitoxin system HicB family antitoxin [Accumulibacter sp.]MCM8635250.1 toxin-antitoxin system HicB family antitoxin [Accumulibacter sp.]MCM8638621.1 toxin-antitoxin system HicB family antitoxin [Accumulibacter sp.]
MTTLNLTLPNSIQRHLQEMADLEGVPIDQFIASAVAEKISALTAETYLQTRADRADPAAFQAILDQVPQRAPLTGDE